MRMINELIDQIGGRDRLEAFSAGHYCSIFECRNMARALLAVLDAQSKPALVLRPFGYDGETFRKSDIDHHAAVVYYPAPPAASAAEGWKLVPIEPTEEMNSAGWEAMNAHDAINLTYSAMLAAAPAPGGEK